MSLLATALGCGDDPLCEVDALVADEFQVIWPVQGIDSTRRVAYYAKAGGAVFEVYSVQKEGGPRTDRRECATLVANVLSCDSGRLRNDLCLVCTDPSDTTTLCR